MAIRYYAPGEHGSGFVGFRVTVAFNKDYRQEYFSTTKAKVQDESDPFFRYEKIKAEMKEAEWQADSLLYQYQVFVSQNHPTTKPYRGVGVHGITCTFFKDRRGSWKAAFSVKQPSGLPKRITFLNQAFSDAWRKSVAEWGKQNEILEEDIEKVTNNPPLPDQFKHLRRHLNEEHGYDIPVEALSPVFAEQRGEIARKRALEKAEKMKLSEGLMRPPAKDMEAEMTSWFESETSNA